MQFSNTLYVCLNMTMLEMVQLTDVLFQTEKHLNYYRKKVTFGFERDKQWKILKNIFS